MTSQEIKLTALYSQAMKAQRNGGLYSAFPYPTKISPETIALFIATHTKPGDTVFDGFAGSGTTGIAARLCENPTDQLIEEARQLGVQPKWGPRNVVLYELGALGAFISRTLTDPPFPRGFLAAAETVLQETEHELQWMYSARSPQGEPGSIRHVVWSDFLTCPSCDKKVSLWDASVSLEPAIISPLFSCPHCHFSCPNSDLDRVTVKRSDGTLGVQRTLRHREPARVYGSSSSGNWSRPPIEDDQTLLRRINRHPIPETVPVVPIPWGDLYRSGYHVGLSHLHHFYTRRNLIVFATLWRHTLSYRGKLQRALRFWLLSYNASHATIMTRVVAKKKQRDLIVTSAQPGVLYVSGLPVEKNLFSGLRRKLKTVSDSFELMYGGKSKVRVYQRSSCNVHLSKGSIDYVFTDPPFGGNIPYAELNFINEAWLGRYTDTSEEAIVSRHQAKSVADYQALLAQAFSEVHRILRPRGSATVIFHSASASVWAALQNAYEEAGLGVHRTSVLDKTQGSFKQVTTNGAVRGDAIIELRKKQSNLSVEDEETTIWKIAQQLHQQALNYSDPIERTPQRLFSRFVTYFVSQHRDVPIDAGTFYAWLESKRLDEVESCVSE